MNLVILSKRSRAYTTERLARTARERGHVCRVLDPEGLTLCLIDEKPRIYLKSRRLLKVDCALPRLGSTQISDFSLSIVSSLETLHVTCLNPYDTIVRGRDKFRCLTQLATRGVPIPRTLLARRPEEVQAKVELIGGPPVILKLIAGSHGVGMIFAENMNSIVSIIESFWEVGRNILIQELVPESRDQDIRTFLVGGKVVAAMRRYAPVGEFREALDRATPLSLAAGSEVRLLAERSAQILGLDVATVDLIETKKGHLVTDFSWSPTFEVIERVTEVDLAEQVIRHAEDLVERRPRGLAKAS